jgi:hypothetical protein
VGLGDAFSGHLHPERAEASILYRNDGDGMFSDVSAETGLADTGWSGGGVFAEISDAIGAENYWPWGISVGDLNADGWEDVFIASSMNYPFRYGINTVLLNNRGAEFLDSEFILGVEPKGTRSSVMFDLDDDGDLDIVTNEFNDVPQVLISDLAKPGGAPVRRLVVKLAGTGSNRDGLGALVTVAAGALTQTRLHDGKSGYLSQSSLPLYFGLGDAERVDRVEVLWPTGRKQTLRRPAIEGDRLEIVEP